MSTDELLKVLIGTQLGLASMFVWHLFKCRDTRIDIATIRGSIDRIQHDIGDHETGIRGEQHRQTRILTAHEYRLKKLDGEDAE